MELALTDRHGLRPIRYYITINEPNMLVLNTCFGTQFRGGERRPTVYECRLKFTARF
jgi:6-phospho-beta-galactosidase/beta-glucosidase